ncbi:MAG: methyltransferase, partial [Oscillochloris sp.]|nr:methyltransferase [Oscillochloris sp.]
KVDIAIAEAFIAKSHSLLGQGGRLALVANRFLPYERVMATYFPRVTRLAENNAYYVLVGDV